MISPFRESALEKIASPEQLDEMMQITDPKEWIALVAFLLLTITLMLWSIFGIMRDTVDGMGILVQEGGVQDVIAISTGQIDKILFNENDIINKGDLFCLISQPGINKTILDNQQLINELERKHEEFLSYGIKDLILAKKVLDEREIILNEGITRVNEKILFFQEQVSSGDDLLQKGLITKASQLQSKQNLSYAKEELKNNINQLKQIDKSRIDLEFQQKQKIDQLVQELNGLKRHQTSLEQSLERTSKVVSPYTGRLLDIPIDIGNVVQPGTVIAKLDIEGEKGVLKGIFYVSANDGKKIKNGMEVRIMPGPVKPEEYGVMYGVVRSIAGFPSTTQAMLQSLKNDQLVMMLSKLGAPFEFIAEPIKNNNTISGYKWSSKNGPPFTIGSNTPASIQITVKKQRPIILLIPFLKKFFGLVPQPHLEKILKQKKT